MLTVADLNGFVADNKSRAGLLKVKSRSCRGDGGHGVAQSVQK